MKKYGVYLNNDLMCSYDSQTEAFEARSAATEETGISHDVKPHSFEVVKGFAVDDIDGCEFVWDKTITKCIVSLETDGAYGVPTGRVEVVYPDGSIGKITEEEAQKNFDSGEWLVYR